MDTRVRWFLLTTLLLLLACWLWAAPASVRAQDEGSQPETTENKAAEAPAAVQQPNLFRHILASAGWFFGPLLLLVSVGLVALIVLLSMDLRMTVAIPPTFVDQFTDTVNKRRFREAFEMARDDTSFLGKVLSSGMARLQYGIEDARDCALATLESVRAGKDQLITYLATIGTLGPMLGLVGTVYGMIIAFMELSQPGKSPNPQRLADGISHALVITLLGVGIAVPAIFCHAFFRNRLTQIALDTSNVADDLLTQMYHNSRKASTTVTDPKAVTSTGKAED